MTPDGNFYRGLAVALGISLVLYGALGLGVYVLVAR